jgi:hypothetical protein
VDATRDRYEARATFLFESGLGLATDWTASEAAVWQLKIP